MPTPEALANHLEAFKTISERGDCSIIVTNITVDGLDEMKTQSKEARDTTRWLETLLARCTGNIQSMAQPEQKSLQRLRRQDRQVNSFKQKKRSLSDHCLKWGLALIS